MTLALSILTLLCQGCGQEVVPDPVPQPESGGALRIIHEYPNYLDPIFVDDIYEATITNQIYEGLVKVDEHLGVTPSLAESWVVSDDGLTYTFHLRDEVSFHNGDLLDAEVVCASLSRIVAPNKPRESLAETYFDHVVGASDYAAGEAETVSGFRVVDARTFEVQLEEPLSFFLSVLTMDHARIVPAASVEGWTQLTEHPVGTGPFEWGERREDQTVILTRNDAYWGESALLDSLVLLCRNDASEDERLALLVQGKADVAWILTEHEEIVQKKLGFRIIKSPELSVAFLGMNCEIAPLDDPLVRKAIAHCVRRQSFLDREWQDIALASGILPPGMPGYRPQSKVVPYDLAAASEIMAGLGFTPEAPTEPIVMYSSSSGLLDSWVIDEFQPALASVGIHLELRNINWVEMDQRVSEGTAPIFSMAWIADLPDADGFLYPLFHGGTPKNLFQFADDNVEEQLALARSMRPGPERLEAYREVESQVLELSPMIPLYHEIVLYAWAPAVDGLQMSPYGFATIPFDAVWLNPELRLSPEESIAGSVR